MCVCVCELFCVVFVLFCAHTQTHLPKKLGFDTDTLPTPRNVGTWHDMNHGNMETYELVRLTGYLIDRQHGEHMEHIGSRMSLPILDGPASFPTYDATLS